MQVVFLTWKIHWTWNSKLLCSLSLCCSLISCFNSTRLSLKDVLWPVATDFYSGPYVPEWKKGKKEKKMSKGFGFICFIWPPWLKYLFIYLKRWQCNRKKKTFIGIWTLWHSHFNLIHAALTLNKKKIIVRVKQEQQYHWILQQQSRLTVQPKS